MIYRVLATPSGAGLADINSMGPNSKIFTETTVKNKPVRVSKQLQEQIATNIISTSLQPIGRLGVDYC